MSHENEIENVVDEQQDVLEEIVDQEVVSEDESSEEMSMADEGFLNEEDLSDISDCDEEDIVATSSENDEDLDMSMEESEELENSAEEADDSFDMSELDDYEQLEAGSEGELDTSDEEDSEESEDEQVVFELEEVLELKGQIEAIIFASPKPVKVSDILEIIGTEDEPLPSAQVEEILTALVEEYKVRAGGFRLDYVKRQGYQFRTVQAAAPLMEKIFSHRPRPLSKAALETLAIIAYRQPVTRADIEFVRGVDAGSIVKNLLERELVSCVGRKEVAGRPMLFGTTDEFLRVFGVGSIKELPPLSAFQPSPEMVQNALDAMDDEAVKAVDVEKLIGDGSDKPEVSEGIVEVEGEETGDAESALFDEDGEITAKASDEEVDFLDLEEPAESDLVEESMGLEGEEDIDLSLDTEVEVMNAEETLEAGEEIESESITELDQPATIVLQGAELADMEGFDSDDGKDQDTEMDVPTGDSLEKGSGEMDL